MKRNLFKLFFTAAAVIGVSTTALATIHTIHATGMMFSPNTLTIQLGDTVQWMWMDGFHTTTSTSVPAGAVAWDEPLDANHTTYTYIPSVIGTYDFKCIPHESMGMLGSFTVTPPLGVKNISDINASVNPNPAKDVVRVTAKEKISNVQLFDISGRLVRTLQQTNATGSEQTYSVTGIASGTYFLQIQAGDKVAVQKLVIQ
jgi:plastocyanin